MKLRVAMTASLALSCLTCSIRADTLTVTGHVTDAAGKPVADAELASFWMAEGENMKAYQGVTTDVDGKFSLKLNHYGRPIAVLGLAKDRKTGGLFSVDPKSEPKEVTVKLEPLV